MNILITNLERQTTNDFVTVVHYRIEKTTSGIDASTYGTVGYTQDGDKFVAFEDLTPAIVTGWLEDSLDLVAIEASLDAQIALKAAPMHTSGMPWDESVVEDDVENVVNK